MDGISGISYYLNECQTLSNASQVTFVFFQECACNTVQLLRCCAFDFRSPETCPNSPKLNALSTRVRESYAAA